ncbi:KDGP aldolase [Paenibacillus sp. N1-5-1-14]|uniref:KDGP aldolase n=1 Tax=Paenibacillus radicibacter TaxID=2972488 RepID=UPI002158C3F4|nr:KDGP aldolase [Paenibacillus radicibacter]MCR8644841.1 KDGP aldolase [Paenibacillus radicibacter]
MTKAIVKLNVLAKNLENAKQIVEAAQGDAYIGRMVKDFPTVAAAIEGVNEFQAAGVPVSVGLGAGDPAVWKEVVDVSVATKPVHVNQVFPAAGYTLGAMRAVGSEHTIVNALITPSGKAGHVYLTTGPTSRQFKETVTCEAAAAMLAEIGIHSVKFYPIGGQSQLDEVAVMVRAATEAGIEIFEPTGGIDLESFAPVVKTCVDNGAKIVIPHLYTSIINKETGLTNIEDIHALMKMI